MIEKLEQAVATRQEAEAKLIQAESTIKELMNSSTVSVRIFITMDYTYKGHKKYLILIISLLFE